MTAPARPVPRTDRPPTLEQLLVLADRAERGQLTPAEAARLRQGLEGLRTERQQAAGRASSDARQRRAAALRLRAVHELVRTARQRGARSIPIQILAAAVQPELRLPPREVRPAA